MRREYRLSEEGKERMLRRSNRVLPALMVLLVIVMCISAARRSDAAHGPVARSIPYALPGVVVIVLIVGRRRWLGRQFDQYRVVITDDDISVGGAVAVSIPFDRIKRVEIDAHGNLSLRAANDRTATRIVAEVEGIEEIQGELSRRFGGISPRPPATFGERRSQILAAVMVAGFLASTLFSSPVVVVPSALVSFTCIVYAFITYVRTYGSSSKTTRFMLLIGIGMTFMMVARVVTALALSGR